MKHSSAFRSIIVLCALAVLGMPPFLVSAQFLGPTGNSQGVRYMYDAQGMRVFEEERTPLGTTITNSPTSAYREIIHPDGTVERIVSIEVAGIPVATIRTVGTGTPEVFATHADHLRSTRLVTTEGAGLGNVNVVEETDYDPFGKITKHEQSGDFSERRKFTSHEFDSATNYTYAKARYLNTEDGRFLSQDPAFWEIPEVSLADPQQLNSYSYARNNPVKFIDPTGRYTVVIPGTFYNASDWSYTGNGAAFLNQVSKTFGETAVVFNNPSLWSGGNNQYARMVAAQNLTEQIESHAFAAGEKLNIVGHSHGGNVAALVSNLSDRKIDNLVTLGTPVRGDYEFNETNIGNHVNAYTVKDKVQILGGGTFGIGLVGADGLLPCQGSCFGATSRSTARSGVAAFEFGGAGREVAGVHNVSVPKSYLGASSGPLKAHSFWKLTEIWEDYISPKVSQ